MCTWRTLGVRVSAEDGETIRRLADRRGQTVSRLLKSLLEAQLAEEDSTNTVAPLAGSREPAYTSGTPA